MTKKYSKAFYLGLPRFLFSLVRKGPPAMPGGACACSGPGVRLVVRSLQERDRKTRDPGSRAAQNHIQQKSPGKWCPHRVARVFIVSMMRIAVAALFF